jgi:hypothetical protein
MLVFFMFGHRYQASNLRCSNHLIKLAEGCSTPTAEAHVKVNHTYAFVFEAGGKTAVYVGLVRALIACVDAGSTARHKRLRHFRCLPRTDATGRYFCHPWALVKVTEDGHDLQLEVCKRESHDFYAMLEAERSGVSHSDDALSTDEESDEAGGSGQQGAGRRRGSTMNFAVNGLEMEVPVVWSMPPAEPVLYADEAMPMWRANLLALVQKHLPQPTAGSGKRRK